MKRIIAGFTGLLMLSLPCRPAAGWSHAGGWGGSTSHSWGSTSHTNAWGGSSEHTYGEGTEHTNAYGGSTAHAYGGGTEHTNMYGGSTAGAYGEGAWHTDPYGATAYHPPYYGGYYPAYHPPTTVNYYGSGCYDCGGWSTAGAAAAGAMVGVAAGATIASANTSAATSNAYSAGYAAGSAANPTYPIGAIYATLPPGCTNPSINGMYYYLCGNTWFQPSYGANGVYYRVVPTP